MGQCLQKQDVDIQPESHIGYYHRTDSRHEVHIPPVHMIRGPPAPKQRHFNLKSLQELASNALLQYIYRYVFCILQKIENKPLQNAFQECLSLQCLLEHSIPARFGNELTEKVLCFLDGMYKEGYRISILQELISAIIHPSVTKLDLHYSLPFISHFMFRRLSMLTKLKELKLYHIRDKSSEPLIINGLNSMVRLEVFALHYHCTDSIMTALGNKCKHLKCLDVAFSASVTDISIEPISRLSHLEEIDLTDTSITGLGYIWLLTSTVFSKSNNVKNILHRFGCSQIQTSHFNILLNNFTSLSEVNIKRISCDQKVKEGPERLNNVQSLKLTDCMFIDIEELLIETGTHLVVLELNKISDLNVKVIGKHCVFLEKLIIKGYVRHVPHYEANVKLPGFESLQCISLHLYRDYPFIEYLLSKCSNVRKVDLFITDGSEQETDNTIESVLSRNPMAHLEEFSIKTHMAGFLTMKTVKLLAERCPNITSLYGVNTWSSIGVLENFVEEMEVTYPHIELFA